MSDIRSVRHGSGQSLRVRSGGLDDLRLLRTPSGDIVRDLPSQLVPRATNWDGRGKAMAGALGGVAEALGKRKSPSIPCFFGPLRL